MLVVYDKLNFEGFMIHRALIYAQNRKKSILISVDRMKNKDKFTLKEAFEVIAKHMQSLVKDELKKAETDKKVEEKPTEVSK